MIHTEPRALSFGEGYFLVVLPVLRVLELGQDVGGHGDAVAHRVLAQVGRHRGQDLHVGAASAGSGVRGQHQRYKQCTVCS